MSVIPLNYAFKYFFCSSNPLLEILAIYRFMSVQSFSCRRTDFRTSIQCLIIPSILCRCSFSFLTTTLVSFLFPFHEKALIIGGGFAGCAFALT